MKNQPRRMRPTKPRTKRRRRKRRKRLMISQKTRMSRSLKRSRLIRKLSAQKMTKKRNRILLGKKPKRKTRAKSMTSWRSMMVRQRKQPITLLKVARNGSFKAVTIHFLSRRKRRDLISTTSTGHRKDRRPT
uniref:(northern house mosquito) hypothetical protein n=1 Tax=Culex pipiens TaxID=7175 RepID=A0A8D8C0N9_CULPI